MRSPVTPPRLPERNLSMVLRRDRYGETILGDLQEEFRERAEVAPAGAYLTYWRDALGIAARHLLENAFRRERRIPLRKGTLPFMDPIFRNLRYALRRLAKSPLFTLVAILSLALGIGANTAIFSLVNAIILPDLPLEDVETLVDVYESQEEFSHSTLSYPDYRDVVEGTEGVFTGVNASVLTLIQADTETGVEAFPGESVTGNYFSLLGVKPVVGRFFTPEDDVAPGAHPVVVLGHGFWQRRFGGDPGVVGTEIRLGGRPYTIIGVAPEAYTGVLRGMVPEAFVPIMMYDELMGEDGSILESRGALNLFVKARLAPGVTRVQAEGVMDRISETLKEEYPESWTPEKSFVLEPTEDVIMNPMVDRVLVPAAGMIMAVVGLVLLIACANLASFLLARAADRRKEIAIRLALGARRRTLVGQLLTETLVLSGLGGLLGIGLSVWVLEALVRADLPLPFPITLDLSLDGTVLAFSIGISLAAGILFGLAPAIQGTNPEVAPTLRDESAGGGMGRSASLRNLLVMGQVAVSVVLLASAGLFLRSLAVSTTVDPGFGTDPAGILQIVVPATRYTEEEGRAFTERLVERLRARPDVQAAGLIDNLLLNNVTIQTVHVEVDGVEPPPGQDYFSVDNAVIDGGFLEAAGVTLLAGRNIDEDDLEGTEAVALVNETFARRFFPDGDPVGRTIRIRDSETLVVGMTRDTRVRNIGEDPRPFIFRSYRQVYSTFVNIVARTSGDAGSLALEMMAAAREMDPEIMVVDSRTMERHLAVQLLPRRLGAMVVAAFAILALILASIGLYGVVSYAVARRSREVGIRLSLGAEPRSVVRMLTGGGMRLVAMGGVVGLVLSALLARLLSSLLYGISVLDPLTFLGVPVVLGMVAFLAAWLPARRASRVNPVVALKSD